MQTPDTRYLGSFAAVLADELPGTWTSTYHPNRRSITDHDYPTHEVWDMNLVAEALAEHVVDRCAILTRGDGARLFVMGSKGHDEGFLIAAMAPRDLPAEAFRGVREPDGIAVADNPFSAAEAISRDLLPRYDKALAQVRHNAARLAPAPAAEAERLVMTWFGDALHVAKPAPPEAAKILADNGFVYDADQKVFILAGDDTTAQAVSVRAVGAQLARLDIGVVLRHPPARPALDTTAVAPPAPPVVSPRRGR